MSGDPTGYTDDDAQDIYEALLDALADYDGEDAPTSIRVDARIEFQGDFHRRNNGKREVNFHGANLAPVVEAVHAATAAGAELARARPSASLNAKGWHAQLSALTGSKRGAEAADRAGLNVTSRTLTAWLSESREPNKANRARIAQAYESMRTDRVRTAQDRKQSAVRAVADALSDALKGAAGGADVRVFDPTDFELG